MKKPLECENTYFELLSYQLLNLPTKARLVEPSESNTSYETNWHGQTNAYVPQTVSNTNNTPVYNAGALGYDNQKSYTFEMYLPEYYILPLPSTTENYGDQKYKPVMYDSENRTAICVKLKGTYPLAFDAFELWCWRRLLRVPWQQGDQTS